MESLLKCRKFEVVSRPIPATDGRPHRLEYVVHPGAVVILPLLSPDECVMIRNHRPALDLELWDLPAGTLDRPGEDPRAAGARELIEETGYRAGSLSKLCEFYSAPGCMTELLTAFVAEDLSFVGQRLEPTERIQVEPMPLADALAMVRDGRIMDAKTIVTLLRWDMERRGN